MADLKEQLNQALADLKTSNDKVAELEAQNKEQAEVFENLFQENEALATANTSLKEEIARLMKTPDNEEGKSGVGELFEHEGAKYKLLVSAVIIPGLGKRTALEILTDTNAQAKLVASASGCIQKIV